MLATPPIANLLVLRSSDIHRAVRFYESLGLFFDLHSHKGGPEHYSSSVGGFTFEIYPLGQKHTPTHSTRLGFHVADVDGIVASLQAEGVTLGAAPTDSEWGRRAVVRDFDGHVVELLTSPNVTPHL